MKMNAGTCTSVMNSYFGGAVVVVVVVVIVFAYCECTVLVGACQWYLWDTQREEQRQCTNKYNSRNAVKEQQ